MISRQTTDFLKELKKHNNREWFEKHKEEFQRAHAEFSDFVHELAKDVSRFDNRVKKGLLDKKTVKIFRIYRDVRFSKNKTPYKVNFGGTISPGGMEGGNPGYYIHVEPGNSVLAGGLHMPDPKVLARIRETIAKKDKDLRKILNNSSFKRMFKGLDPYNVLKTIPQGFPKDHPAADLLRFKSFLVLKNMTDKEIHADTFRKNAVKVFQIIKPLNDYLVDAQKR